MFPISRPVLALTAASWLTACAPGEVVMTEWEPPTADTEEGSVDSDTTADPQPADVAFEDFQTEACFRGNVCVQQMMEAGLGATEADLADCTGPLEPLPEACVFDPDQALICLEALEAADCTSWDAATASGEAASAACSLVVAC